MPKELKFANDETLKRIVDHTMAATAWKTAYSEEPYPEPSLFLVHDDGVYLMTAAKEPLLLNPETDNKRCLVAYAEGLDPNKDEDVWERAREVVGGDDFGENVPCRPVAEAIAQGYQYVKIRLTKKALYVFAAGKKKPAAATPK